MTGNGITQIVLYTVILTALAYPLGIYMSRVYAGTLRMPRWLTAPERGFYRLMGTRVDEEQGWKAYAKTSLVFMGVFAVLLYLLLRLQGHLPLNPDGLDGVNSWVSMNTTASFITNTNWQYYGGEYTMSYLSQMAGLAVQNFVSAALGMAVLAAVIRGFSRRSAGTVGNFWVDFYRSLVYILLPLAAILALLLVSQGVVQTFDGAATATTVEGGEQQIARGPAATQIAIKQLGTNGGGFYNSNSAVPFENPERLHEPSRAAGDPAHPRGAGLHVRPDDRSAPAGAAHLRSDAGDVRDRHRGHAARGAARLSGAARFGRQYRVR